MENRVKVIVIALVVVLLASLFFAYQNYTAKEDLQRNNDKLGEENSLLNNKIGKLESSLRDNEKKISALASDLDKVSRDKRNVEAQYEAAKKAQEELAQKLKEQEAAAQTSRPSASVTPAGISSQPKTDEEYWGSILKDNKDMLMQLEKLRTELRNAQITNEQIQRDKSSLELDLSNLKAANEDLKRQIEYNQKVSDSIAQELVREKNDKIQIQESVKTIKDENASLVRQLKTLNTHKTELEKKIQQLQDDKNNLDQRVNGMESKLAERINKISELRDQLGMLSNVGNVGKEGAAVQSKESVELPPIVVRPQVSNASAGTAGKAENEVGKVLAINKDNNFVIIDVGENSGIKVGDKFNVYRQQDNIATIETIQTRNNISACDIKKENKPINIGDAVR